MDRRRFLQSTATTAAGLTLVGSLAPHLDAAPARPDLVVANGQSPEKLVRAAVEALGGMRAFISRGDVVVVKPNIGWSRTPEQAACTNPIVVATLVKMALEAGAKKVKVFDNTCQDARNCYNNSGIEAAAKAAGAEVSHIEPRRFRMTAIPSGEIIKQWELYQDILEADKLIGAPIAKHHSLCRLTMSLKNWMGIMGGNRSQMHQNLDGALCDLATVVKPCLTVLDAVRVLTAHGPTGGNLSDVKKLDTIIAGVDQVAIDSYGATLFGLRGSDLGVVSNGHRRRLGNMDLTKQNIRQLKV
jgi:uncharacterized protein (DUF362 family)